ncbi:enterobactin exporter EntS [Serratia plymuthica]|uniref:MFS transporter n=1 Tax=Serratia plymuthica TaxID=82996 RepID=UPI002178AA79|nr:MFS transporter [Serratia plymuthica]CAI1214589.1 enterobactin exporter EntS [Serratia plymuthica]
MHKLTREFKIFQVITFLIMTANRGAFFLLTWFSLPQGALFVSIVVGIYWWLYTLSLPFVGAAVDVGSKFKASLAGSGVTFLAIINIFFSSHNLSNSNIIVSAMLLSAGAMVFTASSISFSALLVPNKTLLAKAFKVRGLTLSFTTFIGPGLGGILLATIGYNAMSLMFVSLSLLALILYSLLPIDRKKTESMTFSLSTWYVDTKAGFNAVRKIPTEYYIALFMMLLNLFITPFLSIALPLMVVEKYHFNSTELGAILALFGIGVILGSFIITIYNVHTKHNFKLCLLSVLALGTSFVLCTTNIFYIEIYFLVFIAGVSVSLFNAIVTSSRATAIPDEYRSRIETFVLFIAQISIPVGSSLSGVLISWLGVSVTICVFGVCILLASFLLYFVPKFRGLLTQKVDSNHYIPYYQKEFPEAFR